MDDRRDTSLRQALHCLKMADFSKDLDLRAGWLDLAERWLKMIRSPPQIIQRQSEPADREDGEGQRRA